MKGKIGSLHKGQIQVGGVLDYELELILSDYQKDAATYRKLSKWKVTAHAYWLYDIPDKVIVRLYADSGGGYWEGVGYVTSQLSKIFDTLLHSPIEIIGEGELLGRT